MKKTCFLMAALLSTSLFAEGNILQSKELNLGNISNAEANTSVQKSFEFIRNAKTPSKVDLKFQVNFLEKDCVSYEVKQEEVPEFKKIVCEGNNNGFHCEEKIFSGLFNAKTVCTEQGLIRKTAEKKITLNFKDAVKLAPTASEKISVSLKQSSMKDDGVDFAGAVIESASLYTVKNGILKDQIHFKAK